MLKEIYESLLTEQNSGIVEPVLVASLSNSIVARGLRLTLTGLNAKKQVCTTSIIVTPEFLEESFAGRECMEDLTIQLQGVIDDSA